MYNTAVAADDDDTTTLAAAVEATVCFPDRAEPAAGWISFLNKVGIDLLHISLSHTHAHIEEWGPHNATSPSLRASVIVVILLFLIFFLIFYCNGQKS